MRATTILGMAFVLASAAGCSQGDMRQPVFAAPPAPALTANVGDTVMDVRIMRPRLSAIGMAGTVGGYEIGRVRVEFAGVQNRRAVLIRHYLAQTVDHHVAPLWTPTGVPSSDPGYVAAAQPQAVALEPGEVLPLEGRLLIVRRVDPATLEYTVEDIPSAAPVARAGTGS
jgi:hypothetical protein